MEKQKKVEFIESYIKMGDGDYQWYDNHGELIRCKDCKYCDDKSNEPWMNCLRLKMTTTPYWFCADGEHR